MSSTRNPRSPVVARLLAACAVCAVAGCGVPGPVPGDSMRTFGARPPDAEFRDRMDLLRSIRRGTFAERAGLDLDAIAPPPPVTIAFVSGTDVPETELPKVRELASWLKGQAHLTVHLRGCSDPPGSEALNRRISQQRAESVASLLYELGVAEPQIGEVVGRGEDCEVKERAVHAHWAGLEEAGAES